MLLESKIGTVLPILSLWGWAAENAPDGDLSAFTREQIERASDWGGTKGEAIQAMIEVGFIKQGEHGLYISGWMDYSGQGVKQLKARRSYQKKYMKEYRSNDNDNLGDVNTNVNTNNGTNVSVYTLPLPLSLTNTISDPDQRSDSNERLADSINEVIVHYRTHHPRFAPNVKSDSAEYRKIRDRLKEGSTVQDLKDAIDGYHLSPFHTGKEPGKPQKHLGIGLIMRDSEHVTAGIEFKNNPPSASTPLFNRNIPRRPPAEQTSDIYQPIGGHID